MRRGKILALLVTVLGVGAAALAPGTQAAWMPPVNLLEGGYDVGSPNVVLDSDGNATAVWDRWDGSDTVVEAAYRPAGKAWGTPIVISGSDEEGVAPGRSNASSPRIVVDRNDNVTVCWERYGGDKILLQSVDRPAGGGWGEPETFGEAPLAASPEPWIASDWEGNQAATWDQDGTIHGAFRPFAGDWDKPEALSPPESFTPETAMDARGDATAVWMHHQGDRYLVESAYRPEQGEWEEPVLVSEPDEEGGNPRVAIDGSGNSLVVWRGEDHGEEFLRAAYRPAGGEWSRPADVSAPGEAVRSPIAAIDPAGNAIAAWAGYAPGPDGHAVLHASFKPAGDAWEAPETLSDEDNSFPSDLVFDNSGNAVLTWQRWDGISETLLAAYRPAGGTWEQPTELSEEGKEAMGSAVVLDAPGLEDTADGYATAVWVSAERICTDMDEKPFCRSDTMQTSGYDPDGLPEVEVAAPVTANVGEPVEVSANTTGLLSPLIDFGDGTSVSATEATHVYKAPGTYSIGAGGAELLGYRAEAERQIVVSGNAESKAPAGGDSSSQPAPTPTPQASPPAPVPTAAPPAFTPTSSACLAARAANRSARRQLHGLLSQSSPDGAKHLAAARHHRQAVVRRTRAIVASSC